MARVLAGPRLPATPIDRARVMLVEVMMHDIGALDVSAQAAARAGSRLVPALASAVTGTLITSKAPLHREIARAWKLDEAAGDLVRRCLVLAADHELNASTYVARCIASTGASPYAAVLGALGALSGPRHGGETSKVESLLREVQQRRDVKGSIAERLQRGERIPGFGQPLYPNGDPRGVHILHAIKASKYGRQSQKVLDFGDEIVGLIGRRPTVDFALGLVSIVLKLPPGSGLGIFMVGRTVGWIAHAIEQYATHALIRPRARYVGPLPTTQ